MTHNFNYQINAKLMNNLKASSYLIRYTTVIAFFKTSIPNFDFQLKIPKSNIAGSFLFNLETVQFYILTVTSVLL